MKQVCLSLILSLFIFSCGEENSSGGGNNQVNALNGYQYQYTGNLVNLGNQAGLQTNNVGIIALYSNDYNVNQQITNAFNNGQNQQVTVASNQALSNSSPNQYSSGQYPTFNVQAIFTQNNINNNQNRICGTLVGQYGSFNATYILYTNNGNISVAGGDNRTIEILAQLPAGVPAYNVCATISGQQGNISLIVDITQ